MNVVERRKAVKALDDVRSALGILLDEDSEGTPERLVSMWESEFHAVGKEEPDFEFKTFPSDKCDKDQLIMVHGIDFRSWCAHHWLPYFGVCHIGYLPDLTIAGLSKFSRVVEFFSSKPTSQEYLASEICNYLEKVLNPKALFMSIQAKHGCVFCRGARNNCLMITNIVRGPLSLQPVLKDEFFQTIGAHK